MQMLPHASANILNGKMEVVISHRDKSILWNVSFFNKDTLTPDFDLYHHINHYWKQLSMPVQDQIFELYTKLRFSFDEIMDKTTLTSEVSRLVKELYDLHKFEDITSWVILRSDIHIPSTLSVEYIPNNDHPGSREQTYLRQDYVHLVVYSISLRLMIPVWGEFIQRTKMDSGTTFKEYYAYQLLANTHLSNCAAVVKLREYVKSNTPSETPISAIVYGVSSEDYPVWILGLVVVRRVCLADVRGTDTTSLKLVTFIYKFIAQKVNGTDGSFAGQVLIKNTEANSSGDEEGGSKYETYKIRQDITIGDRVFIEHVLGNIVPAVLKICPDIDQKMLNTALQTCSILQRYDINQGQVTLVKWIFRNIVPPESIDYVSKATLVQTMGAAQAILWHWGFYDIASIITGIPSTIQEIRVSSVDMKKYSDDLSVLFPYIRRSSSKAKTDRTANHAVDAIAKVSEMISVNDWLLTIDDSLLPFVVNGSNRKLVVPQNIKSRLAELVVNKISRTNPLHPQTILSKGTVNV